MNCVCHDEPMYWIKDPRYRAGGFWACAVKRRATMRSYYHERQAFVVRGRKRLNARRSKALKRRRERQLREA